MEDKSNRALKIIVSLNGGSMRSTPEGLNRGSGRQK